MKRTFSNKIAYAAKTLFQTGGSGAMSSKSAQTGYSLHTLKNEMSKIRLAVQVIRETASSEITEELDIIDRAAGNVEEMIYKCGGLSGDIQLRIEKTDICGLIREAAREQTMGWNGMVEYRMEKIASKLYCDPYHIKEVLSNLISNALDSMGDEGTLRITYRVLGKHMVQIRVADTGCGIPEAERRHIFDLYYTGHSDFSHFGIGLTYCRDVIRGHGGLIRVISSTAPESHGTEFILYLPRNARRGKEMDGANHKSINRG